MVKREGWHGQRVWVFGSEIMKLTPFHSPRMESCAVHWSRKSIILAVGVSLFQWGCGCNYATQSEVLSPSGDKIASVTVINCGAFADFDTQVNIRRAKTAFSARSGLVFGAEGKELLTVEWDGDKALVIYFPRFLNSGDFVGRPIKVRNDLVDGVEIKYHPF